MAVLIFAAMDGRDRDFVGHADGIGGRTLTEISPDIPAGERRSPKTLPSMSQ
jgi:hypothetical protein